MERLISASFTCSSGAFINTRVLAPGDTADSTVSGGAAGRCGVSLFCRSGFTQTVSLFSSYAGPCPPIASLASRSLSCLGIYVAPLLEEKGELCCSSGHPAARTDSECPFLHQEQDGSSSRPSRRQMTAEHEKQRNQVVSVVVSVLLSAATVTFIQTISARPVYATVQTTSQTGGRLIRAEFLSSAWTGFFAGCLHTLSGPDHLAALAPLSIGRTRIESAIVGALWGCGHDAGQMIFGLLFLLLKDRLHIEIIRTWGTRVVGITLLTIGAMGIKEASEVPASCVEDGTLDASSGARKKIGLTTFATGIVHGLQPDALVMILPALALPSRLAGAAFLGMFLVGTILAMGTYTVFIGSCSQVLKERVPRITEKLTWAASLLAIFMGVAIIISQLFGFSLY